MKTERRKIRMKQKTGNKKISQRSQRVKKKK